MNETKLPLVGSIVVKQTLTSLYDSYAPDVLTFCGCLRALVREPRKQQKYEVCTELPDAEKYSALRKTRYSTSACGLIEDALSDFEGLGSEYRDWADNTPDSLQSTDKYQAVDTIASLFENLSQDNYDMDVLNRLDTKIIHLPLLEVDPSRASRGGEALRKLQDVKDWVDVLLFDDDVLVGGAEGKLNDTDRSELEELQSQLETDIGEIEGAEYPNAFGG